jgi:thiol-disulfide isomerase/thioredoxin
MRSVQRVATLALLMFSTSVVAQQDKQDAYDDQLRRGDILVSQRNYEEALKEYKKAYALTNKTSLEAALGMAVAYRGLGAHKNVVDLLSNEAMKLAGDDAKNKAKVYNLRGAALVALAEKPNDKRFADAEADFRAALAANPELYSAQLNLGITLLKQERDEDGRRELQLYVDRAPKGPDTADALRMIEEPRRARETFAPDFSFTSKDGEFISLEDLKGKTVVLDFWGTWCHPCVMATPGLVKLQKKFAEEPVVFISVAENDREDQWAAYIEKNKMVWPQFFDKTRKLVRPFGITSYPTYILIDGDGVVRWRHFGYGMDTDGAVESEIKKTLKRR